MENPIENDLKDIGLNMVVGVDEAGRGPLAGPVVVAAVVLPPNHRIEGINDSKKVSDKKREALAELIYERALDISVSMAEPGVIDSINILNATRMCIKECLDNLKVRPELAIIDGKFKSFEGDYHLSLPYQVIEQGDCKSESVASGSIIAKTTRDHMMIELDDKYPEYGFAGHKGYGTKKHMDAIMEHGPCPIHRRSFSVRGRKIGELF